MTTLTQDLVLERVVSSGMFSAGGWVAFVADLEDHEPDVLVEAFVALDDEDGEPGYTFKRWTNVPDLEEARSIAAEAIAEMDERIERSIANAVEVSLLNAG
jgi:hypothetical protein